MIIPINFNVPQTLVLVYLISIVFSFYMMILNDIINKNTTGETIFVSMALSVIPAFNTGLMIFFGVSNVVDASKWNK